MCVRQNPQRGKWILRRAEWDPLFDRDQNTYGSAHTCELSTGVGPAGRCEDPLRICGASTVKPSICTSTDEAFERRAVSASLDWLAAETEVDLVGKTDPVVIGYSCCPVVAW